MLSCNRFRRLTLLSPSSRCGALSKLVFSNCPTMTDLSLDGCSGNEQLHVLPCARPKGNSLLRYLTLKRFRVQCEDLAWILQNLKHLNTLRLDTISSFEPRCFTDAGTLPSLQTLALRGVPGTSTESIKAVGQTCPNLTSLDVSCNPDLNKSSIAILTDNKWFPRLRALDMGKLAQMSDTMMSAASSGGLQKLEYLGMRAPTCVRDGELTDISLDRLSKTCPLLTTIDVSDWPRITDAGLQKLLLKCPHMRSLTLSGCTVHPDRLVKLCIMFESLRLVRVGARKFFGGYHKSDFQMLVNSQTNGRVCVVAS